MLLFGRDDVDSLFVSSVLSPLNYSQVRVIPRVVRAPTRSLFDLIVSLLLIGFIVLP